jgi:lipopolysaccharide export system protein LptA
MKLGFYTLFAVFCVVGLLPTLRGAERSLAGETKITNKRPVEINSNELTFNRATGLTVFKGAVQVKHQPTLMDADEVQAVSGNRQATAEGNVQVVDSGMSATLTCGHLEYKDQMRYITAHDSPKMTTVDNDGNPVTMESRQMEFFSQQHMAVANQNVKVNALQGRATAGRATYLKDEGRMVLEEEPKLDNSFLKLTSRRITAFLTENRLVAEGNVQATFYPTPQDAAKPSAPTSPQRGQGGPPTGGPNALPAPSTSPVPTPLASPVVTPSQS